MEGAERMGQVRFTLPLDQGPGIVASLLERSYASLIESDPGTFEAERAKWQQYDREVFEYPDSVGACIFLTWAGDELVGFGSYDPRQAPELGIIGHNCVLPEFRHQGFGKVQILEIIRRLRAMGIGAAKVSTLDHPFFVPAQRTYVSCGFGEVSRYPWAEHPSIAEIEYRRDLDQDDLHRG